MIPLGLSAAQLADLNATLVSNHSLYVTVQALTLGGTRLADLSWRLLDGQVNVDATGTVTRSCSLSLLDPNGTMDFDSGSPSDGALYVDRMIQVNYSVRKPGGTQYTIPVFTGPITKLDRTNDVVSVEAQGKELLSMGSVWIPATYKKGSKKVDVIQNVLATRGGETKFDLPDLASALPKDYSIGRLNTPWGVARAIAQSMNQQLFYDGRGVARMRPLPAASVFLFKHGDGGSVTTVPQLSYSTDDLVNVVWVEGATPAGAQNPVTAYATAPSTHPLSPWKLGRNGVPRYLMEVVQNSAVTNTTEATAYARTTLNDRLLQAVDVSFDAMPIPHLDPADMARLNTEDYSNAFRMSKYSIPLKAGASMSVGYLNKVSVRPRRVRK